MVFNKNRSTWKRERKLIKYIEHFTVLFKYTKLPIYTTMTHVAVIPSESGCANFAILNAKCAGCDNKWPSFALMSIWACNGESYEIWCKLLSVMVLLRINFFAIMWWLTYSISHYSVMHSWNCFAVELCSICFLSITSFPYALKACWKKGCRS